MILTPIVRTAVLSMLFTTSAAFQEMCRCQCGESYDIVSLPEGMSCRDCSSEYCGSLELAACTGVDTTDIQVFCFHRESRKDAFIVYGFLLLTIGLLLYAQFGHFFGAVRLAR